MTARSPSTAAKVDLAVAVGLVVLIYMMFVLLDAFETLYHLTRALETEEFDELVLTALCLPFIVIWFSYRRWQDARHEYEQLLASERMVQELEQNIRCEERLKSLGTLAGGIAHEFNNILFPVKMLTELTRDQRPPMSPARANLQKIIEGCRQAQALIDSIQTFGRQQDAELQCIDLGSAVSDALDLTRVSLPGSIRLRAQIQRGRDYAILADPTQIYQLVFNLVNNAADAMDSSQGEIGVSVESHSAGACGIERKKDDSDRADRVILSVTDNGHGMGAATRQQALEPFFTTKSRHSGSGMGLAVVHGIVTSLGGSIALKSTLGFGTEVVICLPRYRGASLQPDQGTQIQ